MSSEMVFGFNGEKYGDKNRKLENVRYDELLVVRYRQLAVAVPRHTTAVTGCLAECYKREISLQWTSENLIKTCFVDGVFVSVTTTLSLTKS